MSDSPDSPNAGVLEGALVEVSTHPDLDDEEVDSPPVTPLEELADAVLDGGGRLADVYQLRVVEGKSALQVASELGVNTPGFVSNYEAYLNLILNGAIPSSPAYLAQGAAAARGLRRKALATLSGAALDLLDQHIQQAESTLASMQTTSSSGVAAGQGSAQSTAAAPGDPIAAAYASRTVDLAKPGVYAFSIGRYRVDQGRSIIKVGMAADIGARMAAHRRNAKTVLPDPIELLRAWETPSYQQAERTLHTILKLADQHYNQPGAGNEWFQTNLDLLDELAKLMGLKLLS